MSGEAPDMSTYTPAHQLYYMENAEKINEKEKKEKRWLTYYSKNKEACKERALARYYKKIGKEQPAKKEKVVIPPGVTAAGVKDLMEQLRVLLPVVKKEETKKARIERREKKEEVSPVLSIV
jgi:hypothetical protein